MAKLTLKVKDNPKRGASKARYDLYKGARKTETYIKRVVALGYPASKARADLKWDSDRGFIEIG